MNLVQVGNVCRDVCRYVTSLKLKQLGHVALLSALPLCAVRAQSDSLAARPAPPPDKNELRYNLSADGSRYFRATFMNQTWVRYDQSNPGTLVNNEPVSRTFDIGLRRTRIQLYGQITDRTFIYFQFGQNNFNFTNGFPGYNGAGQTTPSNRKIAAFFHDALGEYQVFRGKEYLKLGGGLTIVNGLSRFSQPSVSTIMMIDVPVFAQATVDQTDEFSRKLSVYARGQVGKVDYRFILSDPFPINTNGSVVQSAPGANATFAQKGHHKQYQGFLMYQLLDKEPNTLPGYMTGTYLGKRKIWNLEAGGITQARAMWRTGETPADTVYEDMTLWSVASFLDMPLNATKGSAISAYLGYFNYDFGRNYLRYNGIMNPANGLAKGYTPGTQGNAFPMFGTGSVVYGQLGYLLPANLLGKDNGALMPYLALTYANYKALNDPMGVFNVGLNWFIKGHNSKFTLDYQNRPIYNSVDLKQSGRRGSFTLQYQIFI